jgi:hypothetical protein
MVFFFLEKLRERERKKLVGEIRKILVVVNLFERVVVVVVVVEALSTSPTLLLFHVIFLASKFLLKRRVI